MFRNLAEKHILQYCGCDGGSGGDANCGCGGSSDGGGDSDGDGLNDSFDSDPFGGMGSESNMDDPSNTGIGNSAAAAAANTPGGYATDGWGSYTTDIGTFGEDGEGDRTFSSRNFKANPAGVRTDSLVDEAREAQWDAANTFGEKAEYAVDHHLGGLLSMFSAPLGMAVNIAQDINKGYSPGRVVSNAIAGVAAPMVGQTVGKAAYAATENPAFATLAAKGASSAAKSGIQTAAASPTSMADQTAVDMGSTMADETMDSMAPSTQLAQIEEDDPFANAGFGNVRNRQVRSRVSRPLLRG